jgi:hypothetical protein
MFPSLESHSTIARNGNIPSLRLINTGFIHLYPPSSLQLPAASLHWTINLSTRPSCAQGHPESDGAVVSQYSHVTKTTQYYHFDALYLSSGSRPHPLSTTVNT